MNDVIATEYERIRGRVLETVGARELGMKDVISVLKSEGISREWGAVVMWEMCGNGDLERDPATFSVRRAK